MSNEEFIERLKDFVVIYKGVDGKTFVGFDIPVAKKLVQFLEQFKNG